MAFGSWQNTDMWYRLATISACASIVVTAVYILRALGKVMMGPLLDEHHAQITDAGWNEKLAAVILILGVVVVGVAPLLLQHLISPSADSIMQNVLRAGF